MENVFQKTKMTKKTIKKKEHAKEDSQKVENAFVEEVKRK